MTTAPIAIDRGAVLQWMCRLSERLRSSSVRDLLSFGDVDAADIVVSQLFLEGQAALRNIDAPPASAYRRAHLAVRRFGHDCKLRWAHRQAMRHSAPARPTDVLLWPREITHIAVLKPIRTALNELEINQCTLTCHPNSFRELSASLADAVYAPAVWGDVIQAARVDGLRRARMLAAADDWPQPDSNEPNELVLSAVARQVLIEALPAVSVSIANAKAALDQFQPKVIVVGNDLTLEGRAACRVAASRGIPTAVFMHGNITASMLHSVHCADRLLVFGEAHRRKLLALGQPDERLAICGAPHLDRKLRQTRKVSPRLAAGLGLREGQPWILVATSGPGNSISHRHHQTILDNLELLAAAFPAVPIVCKLHRKDRPANYRELLRANSPGNVSVVARSDRQFPYDIFEWLDGCSLVLTGASTVAVEAMLMDVPVVTMDFCGELKNIDFIDAGATTHVTTGPELNAAVQTVLHAGQPSEVRAAATQYVADSYFSLDGRSAERGARSVAELAGLMPSSQTA